MSVKNPWKTQNHSQFFPKTPWKSMVFYIMVSFILILCYFSPFSFPTFTNYDQFSNNVSSVSIISPVLSTKLPPQEQNNGNDVLQQENGNEIIPSSSTCDYTNGEWIEDKSGPLYNGSTCSTTIKDGQNCMNHGRPDTDYLHWRWMPNQCQISRFDPNSFLRILKGKHVAFVGDSLARNQLESLICMLGSASDANLVYSNQSNGEENKFRRWYFPSHSVTVSIYWSPFLVKGVEKGNGRDYNTMYLDEVDERWGSDLDDIDLVVLSVGHWFLLRGVYMDEKRKTELGCHAMEGIKNCTDIGFYDAFSRVFSTSLKSIIQTKGKGKGKEKGIDVIVTTFSPHHFEGDWDKLGACPKTMPYKEGEKQIDGMNDILRKIAVDEVEKARSTKANNVRVAALDVTKLSLLRPDGHPGPYMYYNPFGDGIKERVHNDCVHWCLPGPIDTWNEIMLDIIERWHAS